MYNRIMARMIKVNVNFPKSLRKEIDKARALTGESISGYIRQALKERVRTFAPNVRNDILLLRPGPKEKYPLQYMGDKGILRLKWVESA